MTDLGPIEPEHEDDNLDAFQKFKKQRTFEALELQKKGVVSNSDEIKKRLIDLFTRKSTFESSETKFYEYDVPSSVSETGSNVNVDKIETICQGICDRMNTIEGDMAVVKNSLIRPPPIVAPPPPPAPPLAPLPEKTRKSKSKPRLGFSRKGSMNLREREKLARSSFEKR